MREDAYRAFLSEQGLAPGTLSTRCSTLRRIERAESVDLDAEFERDSMEALRGRYAYSIADFRAGRPNPAKIDIEAENLRKHLAFYRSALHSYFIFASGGHEEAGAVPLSEAEAEVIEAVAESASKSFALERDLQTALRTDIGQLEAGLQIVDGGREARVEAGLIDILAKDNDGAWVVIELKADIARPAVIAQTLAYMASIVDERGGQVRGIIVAADFDQRVELAARAVPSLSLKRYRYKFEFQ